MIVNACGVSARPLQNIKKIDKAQLNLQIIIYTTTTGWRI